MKEKFRAPFALTEKTEELLDLVLQKKYGLDLDESKKLAESVQRLSDYFIQNPGAPTPWQESWCQIAYLVYYSPLNALRLSSVFQECLRLGFFDAQEEILDYGAGLGSVTWAWDALPVELTAHIRMTAYEQEPHPEAQKLARTVDEVRSTLHGNQSPPYRRTVSNPDRKQNYSTATLSYSLIESGTLPAVALNADKIIIVEPSTRLQGRKLMELRQNMIDQGRSVWAPCVHQDQCPLLISSEKDWCHDRIHFKPPIWFLNLEDLLPMKNQTLTFSYLCLSRKKRPQGAAPEIRVVGDLLVENGKRRQLICQNSSRVFLTWMDRHWKKNQSPQYPRGILIAPPVGETKGNEIRVLP
jgi:hypothetical protein